MERNISNEDLNEFHWKNKLEDTGSLSGETLTDKNAAWEKLHSRLRQKPHSIKAVWYWAAAACLLVTIVIPVITMYKKQESSVVNNSTKKLPKTTVREILTVKETAVTNISPPLIIKEKPIKPSIQIKNKKSGANDIVHKEEVVSPDLNDQKYVQQQPAISPPPVIDSPVETSIAAAPIKKKLKVVHINELTDPAEILNTARYYERRSFKLKLINQQAYTSSSPQINHTGFNIFKTKNAPSN